MSNDNLCAVLRKAGDLCLEKRKIPEPADHEVLLAMHSVGICGSDVHYWKSGAIGDFIVRAPMVLGHESSGVVIKKGSKVKHLQPGDRVCIEPGIPCRRCKLCIAGRYNLCRDVKFCATPPDDGSLCQYYCHDADFCYKLPDHVTMEEGALIEPLSVAMQACRRAAVQPGKAVLVCGAGPIGLVNLLTAKAMGAACVCITDICDKRLSLAKELGADAVVNMKELKTKPEEAVISALGRRPDISIECSGAAQSVCTAIRATESGGVVVVIGHGQSEIALPLVDACVREIDIRGVFRYANCYPASLDLVASGKVDLKPLITHRFTLKDTLKAFQASSSGEAVKVIIQCNNEE